MHILTEILTEIGHKIILTDFGQNFPPTCLPRDHVRNLLTEQSVKIRLANLILTEIIGQYFGQTIILTEILTDFGQNFSLHMPAQGILSAFFLTA